ncbi:MAG: hypothetical protein LBV30_03125 [Propionibacteriaceae bacterium]|nr:hypothetical protein [Propionibacteriaceae bacterium]
MKSYLINCDSCQADPTACGDCVMACLAPPVDRRNLRFSEAEADALTIMSDAGLLPPLRLVAAG